MSSRMREIIHEAMILTCGTEILMGQIVNSNAAWLATQLRDIGVPSHYQITVGDNPARLQQAMTEAMDEHNVDLILLTGGLGPTEDDITMACAAAVAGASLQVNEQAKKHLEQYFSRHKGKVSSNNWKQVLLPGPEDGLVLPNENGTAFGAIFRFQRGGQLRHLILLPGPPIENRSMFTNYVLPYLQERREFQLKNLYIQLQNIGESAVVTEIADLIEAQSNPTIAPYCSTGKVTLRLTQRVDSDEEDRLQPLLSVIQERLGEYIYALGNTSLEERVCELLLEQGGRLALAESCTAGKLASALGSCPGVSAIWAGSIVAYQNEAKESLLSVPHDLIEREGAVSAACARAMALGARQAFGSSWSLATTGYAGPQTEAGARYPVGTVFIAVASPEGEVEVEERHFFGGRAKVQEAATMGALSLLYRSLMAYG